jgi:hypothetical protein
MAAEFDKPSNLLSKEDGIFKSLVEAWEEWCDLVLSAEIETRMWTCWIF